MLELKQSEMPPDSNYHGKVPLLIREIRQRMTNGTYSPGQRLPTREKLAKCYGFSKLTVQRAMVQLENDGFIESRGRNGSFVADSPPHLSRYAVVFPHARNEKWWSHLYDAIEHECCTMQNKHIEFFFVCGCDLMHDNDEYQKLIDDVKNERVAGIIFAFKPTALINAPILNTPNLPRVALLSTPIKDSVHAVSTDFDEFIKYSLDYLETQNRKRPAIIFHSGIENIHWQTAQARIISRGMTCPSYWIHGVRLDREVWPEHIVQLLFSADNPNRPDSLIVTDDNLFPAVGKGLLAGNISVPDDVTVVAHANFPWPTESVVPAKRFGIDIRTFLQTAVDIINKKRQGYIVQPKTILPVVDEDIMKHNK